MKPNVLIRLVLGLFCVLPIAGCRSSEQDQQPADGKTNGKSPEEQITEHLGMEFGKAMQEAFSPENMQAQARAEALAEAAKIAALKAVNVKEFEAGWKVAFDAQGRPAGEVLTQLAERIGLSLERPPELADQLGKTVTADPKGLSCLEAIEKVCSQVGLHPVYPELKSPQLTFFDDTPEQETSKTRLSLAAGARTLPVRFAGPFLVETARVEEFPPHGTGTLSVVVRGYGLPPTVVHVLQEQGESGMEIAGVRDQRGRDFHDRERGQGAWPPRTTKSSYEVSFALPLKNLVREMSTLPPVKGSVNISLPTRVETIEFDPPAAGTCRRVGDLEVTLKKMTESTTTMYSDRPDGFALQFEYKGGSHEQIHFVAYDSGGNLLPTDRQGYWSADDQGGIEIGVTGSPAKIIAKVVTQQAQTAYEFELRGVLLASAAEQPVAIEPALFPGHDCPVTLEFVEFRGKPGWRKLLVRVTNHADQDIRNLSMRVDYLDAGGKKLKDWPASESGMTHMDTGEVEPCVKKHSTAEFEVAAFFMPEETKRAELVPEKVVFCNATVWTPSNPLRERPAEKARLQAAKSQIGLLETALEVYHLDVGSLPTTDQGLAALREAPADLSNPAKWNGPYLAEPVPPDPWGHPYQYQSPGRHNPDSLDLWSMGADGVDGTEDDICNW